MTNFEKPADPGPPDDSMTAPPPVGDPSAVPAQPTPPPTGYGDDAAQVQPSPGEQDADAGPGQATQERPAPAGFDERGRVKRGRVSTLWVSLIAAAVFLILLIVFIAQNLKKASIHFLGFAGHMPTGLVILIAAIIGVLMAAIPGTIRILQLRKSLKHNTPREERTP